MESNYLCSNKRENITTKPFLQISLHDVNDANVGLPLQLTGGGSVLLAGLLHCSSSYKLVV